jgi:7,8-dihydropterin-6-yl-methyl-4-(beta-D-ribofuranosyl)aminobenzene 5'-phosphate synthase
MLSEIDSLEILAIVDNEVDPMSPAPPCVAVSGRLGDVGLGKGKIVTNRGESALKELDMEQLCCGAHGLSLMLVSRWLSLVSLFGLMVVQFSLRCGLPFISSG